MVKRTFTDEERKVLRTIPRNMIGKTGSRWISENRASFIYDPNSKKLVTVPIQVTIVPVANGNALMTLSGEHYLVSKNKLVKREGVYIKQEFSLLDEELIYSLSVCLAHVSEAMRNLRWAIGLKALGGTDIC
jgi:hypothetical protein